MKSIRFLSLAAWLAGTCLNLSSAPLVLSDFEGDHSQTWGGAHTELAPETDPNFVKEGSGSGKWANLPRNKWLTLLKPPANWSSFQGLRFWMHSASATKDSFNLTVAADPAGAQGNYYLHSFTVDWTGWKEIAIPLASFKKTRNPVGWNAVTSFVLYPTTAVNEATVYHLDGMRLDDAPMAAPVLSAPSATTTEALLREVPSMKTGGRSSLVAPGPDGKLVYGKDPDGDRIPDYSLAGYRGGGVPIPDVPVKASLQPSGADDTSRIQESLDGLSKLPMENGFRGALLLKKGKFTVSDTIRFKESGVVIRGEGAGFGGTWMFHKRVVTDPAKPEMIHFPQREKGIVPTFQAESGRQVTEKATALVGERLGSGERVLRVESAAQLKAGQEVVIVSPRTVKWAQDLGLSEWWKKPEDFTLRWERTLAAVDAAKNLVTLDLAITSIIDAPRGHASGEIHFVKEESRLSNIGLEDLLCASDYDRSKKDKDGFYVDESHPNQAFRLYNARNAWIRRVVGLHYSYGLARFNGSSFVTVEDCAMLDGVSTDTPKSHVGARKYYFDITGNQILVQRCYGRYGRHPFTANGPCTGGVFLDCLSEKAHLGCEGHQRWSHGFLYDNLCVDASINATAVRGDHGVRMASTLIWNSLVDQKRSWEAEIYVVAVPGMVWNYAVGNQTRGGKGYWANQDGGEKPTLGQVGWIESTNHFVEPRSLYHAQLAERLGPDAVGRTSASCQRGDRGGAWMDLWKKYGRLPEYADAGALPWSGFENWVVAFGR